MKSLFQAALFLSLIALNSLGAFAAERVQPIEDIFPPLVLPQVYRYSVDGVAAQDESMKIEYIEAMKQVLGGLPGCRIASANAIYDIAMSGGRAAKEVAYKELIEGVQLYGLNPIPPFALATANMEVKIKLLEESLFR